MDTVEHTDDKPCRVCVMADSMVSGYSLVSPDSGRVASFFSSDSEAIAYAEEQGWEVF